MVKQREHGLVVAVSAKTVFGTDEAVKARLATLPTSTTINTSFVERDNLTLGQRNRHLTRKTDAFSKELGLRPLQALPAISSCGCRAS